jgi:hypothetical protein
LGSPPEKGGGKKRHPSINPGQTAGPQFQDLVLSVRRGLETQIDTWTDRRTRQLIYKILCKAWHLVKEG